MAQIGGRLPFWLSEEPLFSRRGRGTEGADIVRVVLVVVDVYVEDKEENEVESPNAGLK